MKIKILLTLFVICTVSGFSQTRSFDDIFPQISPDIRSEIFSENGYVKSSKKSKGFVLLGNQQGTRLDSSIVSIVLQRNPGYIVESISIFPASAGSISLLNIYNALGNVRDLGGRLYDSHSRGESVPLFEEASRITSERQTNPIPDPPPVNILPRSDTVFLRLKDVNFGNTFYRADMVLVQHGLRYTMSNFRNMTYLMVPVIREGRFIAQLYFEPIQEGILIYSIAGADISDFFANRIHVESAISKRLAVITEWTVDGIRRNSR